MNPIKEFRGLEKKIMGNLMKKITSCTRCNEVYHVRGVHVHMQVRRLILLKAGFNGMLKILYRIVFLEA